MRLPVLPRGLGIGLRAAGGVGTGVLALVWVVSVFSRFAGVWWGDVDIGLARGQVTITRYDPALLAIGRTQPLTPGAVGGGEHAINWWFWRQDYGGLFTVTAIPMWSPVLLAGLGTAWVWRWARRSREVERAARLRGNRCVPCGYSRVGVAAGAACPECGAIPSDPSPAPAIAPVRPAVSAPPSASA